jgi:DNA topoisomerase IB
MTAVLEVPQPTEPATPAVPSEPVTPAVCRASYIDPRVFDAYNSGLVIRPVLEQALDTAPGELPIHHRAVEEAVLDLIDAKERAPGVERVAA